MIAKQAECTDPDCTWSITVWDDGTANAHLMRSDLIGRHRVKTGHNVRQWTESGDKE